MTSNKAEEPVETQDSLVSHLAELRGRLIYSILALLVVSGISYYFRENLFDVIRGPIKPYLSKGGFAVFGPMDKFMAGIKVSILAGIIGTCPFWMYQLWKFVAPGLYAKEKKFGLAFISSGSFLFLSGVCFVYFVIYPLAFKFLLSFDETSDFAMIGLNKYLSFFFTTTLVFGLTFELPLALTILGIVGIVDKKFLKEKRRYAIVGLAALSAVVTPPDVVSMLLMVAPLILLYELSIILVGIFGAKPIEEEVL